MQSRRPSIALPPKKRGEKQTRRAFKFAAPTFTLGTSNSMASSSAALGLRVTGQVAPHSPKLWSRKPRHRGGAGGSRGKPGGMSFRANESGATALTAPVILVPLAQSRSLSQVRSSDVAGGELAMLMSGLGLGADLL